ncbi:reverse transcriptase domain-containing protein [Tanacetum coccineum]
MAVTETRKVVTRALAQEKQSLLPRSITTKEHPHERRKNYQKVKTVKEGTRSQCQRSKGRAWKAMPTWCHMFNSTLTGTARVWFDDLPPESVDSYNDLKEAFLANFLQQKKCIKDPIELYHIKQREGESTKDFVRRFKLESRDVKGAPEVMRISGFMH